MEDYFTGNTTWLGSAQNRYEFDPNRAQTQYSITNGLGLTPTDRMMQGSGGAYIGGMAPGAAAFSDPNAFYNSSSVGDQFNTWKGGDTYAADMAAAQEYLNANPAYANWKPPTTASPEPQQLPGGGGIGGMRRAQRMGGGGAGGAPGAFSGINPYLAQMAGDITNRTSEMLGQGLMGIDQQAIAAGGYGGSRQGVAEGTAIAKAGDYLSGNLANLFGQDWTGYQNRELQRYGMDQNFYLGNRNTDLNSVIAGANLFNQGNTGWLSQGQGLQGIGNTVQQAPWQLAGQFSSTISPFTGLGVQQTTSNNTGASGVLGGMLGGAQLGNLMFPGGVGSGWPIAGGGGQFSGWGQASGPTGAWT